MLHGIPMLMVPGQSRSLNNHRACPCLCVCGHRWEWREKLPPLGSPNGCLAELNATRVFTPVIPMQTLGQAHYPKRAPRSAHLYLPPASHCWPTSWDCLPTTTAVLTVFLAVASNLEWRFGWRECAGKEEEKRGGVVGGGCREGRVGQGRSADPGSRGHIPDAIRWKTRATRNFREQRIDGSALPLLTEEHLTSALQMKLGPALKLRAVLSRRLGHCAVCLHCVHCHGAAPASSPTPAPATPGAAPVSATRPNSTGN
ncbi:hypothetical protein J6590_003825 [Homalodisca vitripennis]|nr:hypothetical protein J6590_003825 [Homalodisca vitripennis]